MATAVSSAMDEAERGGRGRAGGGWGYSLEGRAGIVMMNGGLGGGIGPACGACMGEARMEEGSSLLPSGGSRLS